MANSDLSKLKILFLYDFFKREVNAFDENNSVSVNDLIAYLETELGYVFERKSIYADIGKINEYVSRTCEIENADSWITVEGRRYRKNEIKGEITIDEVRLLVDAINTTEFIDSNLHDKIRKMFPKYFDGNFQDRALYPHDAKMSHRNVMRLNLIRNAIDERKSLKIIYGYRLGSELTEKSEKNISPMALDWRNSCYYLIAVDNEVAKDLVKQGKGPEGALKHYRMDRIDNVSYGSDKEYFGFPTKRAKDAAIKRFIEVSITAFSGGTPISLPITISGKSRKEILRAYNAFVSRLGQIPIIDDTRLGKGSLDLIFKTADVPTLYTGLFELTTFNDITIDIKNESVRKTYAAYLKSAAEGLTDIAKV